MSLPVVAIIGRPNVGKSSLFNLIAKKQISVVHDYPGVTRDRIYADIEWDDRCFTIADTGGLDAKPEEELIDQVQHQVETAVEEAKVIIFLVDVRTGVMPHDLLVAEKLRQFDKPVFLVVNKVEGQKFDNDVYDFYRLGLGEPIPISCAQNWGVGGLLEQIVFILPELDVESVGLSSSIKIAIVGRPNVGKSSIMNTILGENRMIVSDKPGTTRDAVNIHFVYQHIEFELIDTAGMRRKSSVKDDLEKFSVQRATKSIRQSDIAWLVLDASDDIAKQEKMIANYIATQGKASIILVNKWDLIEKENDTFNRFVDRIHALFPQLDYVPILFVSALTGQRVTNALDLSLEIHREYCTRIPTTELNSVLTRIKSVYPPPRAGKVRPNLKYITQIDAKPPTFLIFASYPHKIKAHYEAYVVNELRDAFGFEGTPLRIYYRSTSKKVK